jgi:hypothetical protein
MTQAFNLSQLANNLNTSGQLDATDGLTGAVPVANGGTGVSTITANNVILGNGTSAVQVVAPSTSGNVLTSNGTTWVSQAPSGGGVTSLNGQTGAITNTSAQAIGSYVACYFVIGTQTVGQVRFGDTYAGSSAYRYKNSSCGNEFGSRFVGIQNTDFGSCVYREVPIWSGEVSQTARFQSLSLSGTWRMLSYFVSNNNYGTGYISFGLFVRVS